MAVYGLQTDVALNKGAKLYVPGKTQLTDQDVFLGGVGTGVADSALNGATRVYGNTAQDTASAYKAYQAGQNAAQQQPDIQAEIESLRKAQTNAAIASLGKAKDNSLSNLSAERAKIEPLYYGKRNAASTGSQLRAKNFAEFMASRGGVSSGVSAQAELSRQGALQGNIGSLNRDEATAFTENDRQVTDVNNAYEADVAGAQAGIQAQYLQNYINQMNQDRTFNQSQDQINYGRSRDSVMDNRYADETQFNRSQVQWERQFKEQGYTDEQAYRMAQLAMQQQEMQSNNAYRNASLGQSAGQNSAEMAYKYANMEADNTYRQQQIELQQQAYEQSKMTPAMQERIAQNKAYAWVDALDAQGNNEAQILAKMKANTGLLNQPIDMDMLRMYITKTRYE